MAVAAVQAVVTSGTNKPQVKYDLAMVVRPLFLILTLFYPTSDCRRTKVGRWANVLRLVNVLLVAWATYNFLLFIVGIRISQDLTTDTKIYNFILQMYVVGSKNGIVFVVTFFRGNRLRAAYGKLQQFQTSAAIHARLLTMRRWAVALGCLALVPTALLIGTMIIMFSTTFNVTMLVQVLVMPSLLAMTLYVIFAYLVAGAIMYTLNEAADVGHCPHDQRFDQVQRYYTTLVKVTEVVRIADTLLSDILFVTVALEIVQLAVCSRMFINSLSHFHLGESCIQYVPIAANTLLLVLFLVKSARVNDKITSSMAVLQRFLAEDQQSLYPDTTMSNIWQNVLFCLNAQIHHVTMLLRPIGNHIGRLQFLEGAFLVEICLWTVDVVNVANNVPNNEMPWRNKLMCNFKYVKYIGKSTDCD